MIRKPNDPTRMDPGGPPPERAGLSLGDSIQRRSPRPDRRTLFGSFAFHLVLVASVILLGALGGPPKEEFETYAVKIYSPPPQEEGPPTPEPEVAAPTIVQQPKVERPPTPPKRVNETKRPEQTPTEKPIEKPKDPEPVKGANPDPTSVGGENLDVDISGQEFPFPEYLENIIRQMDRYFRWSGSGTPSAVVAFYINRDGTSGGIRIVERSGDIMFDAETMSAVELAGKNKAFGPLPDGWLQDRLWVRFRFLPPGR